MSLTVPRLADSERLLKYVIRDAAEGAPAKMASFPVRPSSRRAEKVFVNVPSSADPKAVEKVLNAFATVSIWKEKQVFATSFMQLHDGSLTLTVAENEKVHDLVIAFLEKFRVNSQRPIHFGCAAAKIPGIPVCLSARSQEIQGENTQTVEELLTIQAGVG
ncbi:hypothetical protein BD410DRAFT_792642 [Rickenella mellea]|uniref:Uncharacterized protein n=1 Tax=Rickenella mellea TaxID=50990 RepID=A0A4Y7PVT9_9AGAM|nr:hypothetical protein BD410DRAFT_792642 [Rickenella mellea]